ncbi:hypothetical protein [Kribbella sp. NPDC051718]|uniref:hypothetical protein n=1 Tax=Kribbella sp. NPDC051718 TaxID=3155168 RepID=UPI003449D879
MAGERRPAGSGIGDEFAHVTTNISPSVDGMRADFFFTEDVVSVVDARSGEVLYQADVSGGE